MSIFQGDFHSENAFVYKDHKSGVELFMKREDLLHPEVSGNKFRKLKYNFAVAKAQGFKTLLTYGGAFSNHIAATAKAGQLEGFKTIGIIRGDELAKNISQTLETNATLRFAKKCGMQLEFINREDYRRKETADFKEEMIAQFSDFYEVPEGGTNHLAIKGCKEILSKNDASFDYICCAVGTGGTISGIIETSENSQEIVGFPALKGDFLNAEVKKYTQNTNWSLIQDYHFGGYGKVTDELVSFINEFKSKYNIPLDPIYTGKMVYGIVDMIKRGKFSSNTRILAVHTGGLQGISGVNSRLHKKGAQIIKI